MLVENIYRGIENIMITNEFKTYHPVINFIYFAFVIIFSCIFMHPVCLVVSLLAAFIYSVMLKGLKQIKTNLLYILPMILLMAVLNPLFNHRGVTILLYLPSGNPLTFESVIYGGAAGAMVMSVMCHFSCYNEVMQSDKFIYLFGKIIPSLSLLISMTLRFIPRFTHRMKEVANARKCIGKDMSGGNIIKRAKNGISILSVVISWSLENAIDTSDSMKSRGYGEKGRTAFSIFVFDKRDKTALVLILALGIYIITGAVLGMMNYSYFPKISSEPFSVYRLSLFVAYFLLCFMPIIIEIWEARRWQAMKSKI